MAQVIKLRRTLTPDNPPTTLEVGEPCVNLADYPIRMWIGTPSGVQELFAGTAIEDAESDALYGRSDGKWVRMLLVGATAPAADPANTLWWDTDSAQLFVWTGAQWVVATNRRGFTGPPGPPGGPGPPGEQGPPGDPATTDDGEY